MVFIAPFSAPDEATLKDEAHALQCTTAGPYTAISTEMLRAGSVSGLGPDLTWDPYYQPRGPLKEPPPTQAHSPTAWQKFKQLANMIMLPLYALWSEWK